MNEQSTMTPKEKGEWLSKVEGMSDAEREKFLSKYPNHKQVPLRRRPPKQVLAVGQKVSIEGNHFVVRRITNKEVILRAVAQRPPQKKPERTPSETT